MNYLTEQATLTPGGRYAYLAPMYRQVKQAAWDALKQASEAPGVEFSESELRVSFRNGARIQLFGADNYDALRGMHLNGVVLDEYALMLPQAWSEVIRPALAIKQGFAIFIGTPKGRNHFHEMYERAHADPEWFDALYRAEDSGVFESPAMAAELARARTQMPPEEYAQEYECSFEAALRGAYYASQVAEARASGRICPVGWIRDEPVETWWDLGYADATAIIFTQRVRGEVHVIDYLEANREELAYYAKELQRRPYLYERHNLPHDATHKTQAGGGKAIDQQLRELNVRPTVIVPNIEVLDGIQAARTLFPKCWFDEAKCGLLLQALASYRSDWDPRLGQYKREPRHDEYSHGADAFRYLAVGFRVRPATPPQLTAKTAYDYFNFHRGVPKRALTGLR